MPRRACSTTPSEASRLRPEHATLADVIDFYDEGGAVPVSGTLDVRIFPLHLTHHEKADLLAFLETLTGETVPESLRTAPSP